MKPNRYMVLAGTPDGVVTGVVISNIERLRLALQMAIATRLGVDRNTIHPPDEFVARFVSLIREAQATHGNDGAAHTSVFGLTVGVIWDESEIEAFINSTNDVEHVLAL